MHFYTEAVAKPSKVASDPPLWLLECHEMTVAGLEKTLLAQRVVDWVNAVAWRSPRLNARSAAA